MLDLVTSSRQINNSELEIKRCHSQNFVTTVPKITEQGGWKNVAYITVNEGDSR